MDGCRIKPAPGPISAASGIHRGDRRGGSHLTHSLIARKARNNNGPNRSALFYPGPEYIEPIRVKRLTLIRIHLSAFTLDNRPTRDTLLMY